MARHKSEQTQELQIQTQFDYNSLDIETREFVRTKTAEINFFLSNTIQSAIEAGKRFIEVRERLSNNKQGGFEGWLKQEFGMTRKTAYHFIYLVESPSCVKFTQLDIPKSVAYLLTAPATPESAVTEALEKAENGEKLTVKETKELIEAHKKIEEQKAMIESHENQVKELQRQIDTLKNQLPTEDVKKQIEDLEVQIKHMKENPVTVEVEKTVPPDDYEELKKFREESKKRIAELKHEADKKLADAKAELEKSEKELEKLRKQNKKTDEYEKRIAELDKKVRRQTEKISDLEQEKQLSFISNYLRDAYKLIGKAMANLEEQRMNAMQILLPDYVLRILDGMINDIEEIKRRNRIINSEVITLKQGEITDAN